MPHKWQPTQYGDRTLYGPASQDSSSQPSFFNSASCTQFGYRQFRGGIEFVSVGDLRRRILDDVRVDPLRDSSAATALRDNPLIPCRDAVQRFAKSASSISPTSVRRSRTASRTGSGTPLESRISASSPRVLARRSSRLRQISRASSYHWSSVNSGCRSWRRRLRIPPRQFGDRHLQGPRLRAGQGESGSCPQSHWQHPGYL